MAGIDGGGVTFQREFWGRITPLWWQVTRGVYEVTKLSLDSSANVGAITSWSNLENVWDEAICLLVGKLGAGRRCWVHSVWTGLISKAYGHPGDYFSLSRAPAFWFNIYTMLCVNCHGGIPCSFSSPFGGKVLTDKMITSDWEWKNSFESLFSLMGRGMFYYLSPGYEITDFSQTGCNGKCFSVCSFDFLIGGWSSWINSPSDFGSACLFQLHSLASWFRRNMTRSLS